MGLGLDSGLLSDWAARLWRGQCCPPRGAVIGIERGSPVLASAWHSGSRQVRWELLGALCSARRGAQSRPSTWCDFLIVL